MAAMIPSQENGRKRRGFGVFRKVAIRIDMTPMVDLGFLLITFFVFTATLNEPTAMPIAMPAEGPQMPTRASGALTILPGKGHTVYYYEGEFNQDHLQQTTTKGIREMIIHKKQSTSAEALFVIIKPSHNANYRNVVDVLDEMNISLIRRFALVRITPEEEKLMK